MATKSRKSRSNASRKSLSQYVVGTAAMGLPAPVKEVVGSRWGSRIVLVGGVALLASGILTVTWDGNIPHLKVNRERAEEVRKEVRAEVQHLDPKHNHQLGHGHFFENAPVLDKLPELEKKAESAHFFSPRSNPSR